MSVYEIGLLKKNISSPSATVRLFAEVEAIKQCDCGWAIYPVVVVNQHELIVVEKLQVRVADTGT